MLISTPGSAPMALARNHARRCVTLTFVVASLIGGAADAQAAGDPVEVRHAEQQFDALKHHGEALAWALPDGAPEPNKWDHYQGVARYPGPGVPLLYVTQRDADGGGYLHVARMDSRPTSGERLRSNLQSTLGDTDEVDPAPGDTWARSIQFDGSLKIRDQTLPAYEHPGGMAIIDDVLLMALDSPKAGGSEGQLVLFDLRPDPASPQPIRAIPLDHKIDNIAAIRQPDDSILIWMNGNSGKVTRFHTTSTKNLRDPGLQLSLPETWDPGSGFVSEATPHCPGIVGDISGWPTASAYQGSAFLRQTNGELFMVMTRNLSSSPDIQWCDIADLYRVDAKAGGGFRLVRVASKHMYCSYPTAGTLCNFAAAANAYVSPSGELLLYAMPHPNLFGHEDPDFVRMAEFRHQEVSTQDSPLRRPSADAGGPYEVDEGAGVQLSGSGRPAADRPWVELYEHRDWEGRSIVADFDDSDKLELNDFSDLDDFDETASSVSWRAPVGIDVELHEDAGHGGDKHILKGTGKTERIANLADVGLDDEASSLKWTGGEPSSSLSFAWDLDNDGEFDDSTSATPTFGPTTQEGNHTVRLRVTDAYGVSDVDTTTVTVRNAPPDCSTVAPSPSTLWAADHQFRPITLSGATDPGGDPLTLSVTGVTQDEPVDGIADGNTTPDAALVPGHTDQVQLRAERSSIGDGRVYHVAFSVADDQGADCAGTVDVGVVKDIGTGPAIDSEAVFDSFTGP